MFKALQPLLANCAALAITLAADGDKLNVTVIPKPKATGDLAKGLSTPLQLVGTAEELEAEFPKLLASYTDAHTSLAEQVAAAEAVMEAAKKTVVKKAAGKPAGKTAPEKGAAAGGETDDEEGDQQTAAAGSGGSEAAPAAGAATAAVTATNLFDES